MTINRKLIKDLLSILAVFLLPFSVVSVLYFINYGVTEPLLWFLVVPFLLMYVIRKKVNKMPVFVILTLAVVLVPGLIIGDTYSDVFVWIFMVSTGFFAFYMKTREEIALESAFGAVALILIIALFFLLRFSQADNTPMQVQLLLTFLVAMVFRILYTHMDNVDYRLNILSKINGYNDPSNKVLTTNNILITGFVGIVIVISTLIMFATSILRFLASLANTGAAMFRDFLASFTREDIRFEIRVNDPLYPAPYADDFDFFAEVYEMLDLTEVDQGAWNAFLERFFLVVGVAGAICILWFLIWRFYKFYRNRVNDKNEDEASFADTIVALERDVMGDLLDLLPRFKNKSLHPIRRAYAKKVNRYIRAGVEIHKADTTDIIANKIRNAENIDELTAKYEKVRYGK
ncbi:MAG: hypothetical protein FWC32_07235 [Firmicutes bacterium]|nr:hypothetical protein [Bacillota bacterium]